MLLASATGMSRLNRFRRVAAQRLDLFHQLGARASRQYQADRKSAQRLGPPARRAFYATMWSDAAKQVGAEYRALGGDFAVMQRDDAATITWFHHVQLDDPVTVALALDKDVVQRLLKHAGVAVPATRQFSPADPAPGLALLRAEDGSYVVKPAAGTSGGAGVTCAVDSTADFHRAALHASRLGERLLIERAVPGEEYRFLVLDGELIDVIKKRPPYVQGDGHSSVAELISIENARRVAGMGAHGLSFLKIDLDCILTLDQVGLNLRSVVPTGAHVRIKSATNSNAARDNISVDRREIAAPLVQEVCTAASAVGLRFAGVDLITPLLDRSLEQAGGAVIEVNGTPGLHYHYLVADPTQATPVAVPVLRRLLESRRPT